MKLKTTDAPICGRDLTQLLEGCQTQVKLAIVNGKAGSRKSCLVESYKDTWAKECWNELLFASGKFKLNQFRQTFSAASTALVSLGETFLHDTDKEQANQAFHRNCSEKEIEEVATLLGLAFMLPGPKRTGTLMDLFSEVVPLTAAEEVI